MRAPSGAPIVSALGFLTRVPVASLAGSGAADLSRAAPAFPIVGAAIGAAVGAVALPLADVLSTSLAAAIAVALEVALTGALHLDGLADSADGLSGPTPERTLEVMRDHALGAYGVAALTLDLLAKAAALALLAGDGSVLPVVAAYAVSRAAPLPLAAALPYAGGTGAAGPLLIGRLSPVRAATGVLLAAGIAGASAGLVAVPIFAAGVVVTAAAGLAARSRLRGVTGDVLGATVELAATIGLVVAAAFA